MNNCNNITLPSFLRRTLKSNQLKSYIRELGCELSRKGRSRNWQLTASYTQLQAIITFIESEQEESWLWLAKRLNAEYQCISHENLLSLASQIKNITIASLMAQTDCSLLQARKVLDELENLD